MQRDKHRDSTAGHFGPRLPSKPNVLQPLHPSATAEAPGQASALLVQLPVCPVQAWGHDWEETKIPTGQSVPPPAAAHLCFKDAMSCLTWCPQSGTTRPYGYPTSSLLTLLHGINTPSHILILTEMSQVHCPPGSGDISPPEQSPQPCLALPKGIWEEQSLR